MGHDMQELPSLYLLAGHWQSEELVDPAGEAWSGGHDLQDLPSLYWLAAHRMQLDASVDPAREL